MNGPLDNAADKVVRRLSPQQLQQEPTTSRAMMRCQGILPRLARRAKVGGQASRTKHDFIVGESGLSLSHLKVIEASYLAAHTAEEFESGDLALTFRPGDALRALGFDSNGSRPWLRQLLLEAESTFGQMPSWCDHPGETFRILHRVRTDIPTHVAADNLCLGLKKGESRLLTDWRVCITAGYRLWTRAEPSLRHPFLAQLHALGNGPAEAVARFALTGECSLSLDEVLRQVGVASPDWRDDSASAAYQRMLHARKQVIARATQLQALSIRVEAGRDGVWRVFSPNRVGGMWFRKGAGPMTSDSSAPPAETSPFATGQPLQGPKNLLPGDGRISRAVRLLAASR